MHGQEMNDMSTPHRILTSSAALLLCVSIAQAQNLTPAGSVRSYIAETPHPYPPGAANRPAVWTQQIQSPDATFLRLHFTKFDLSAGDYVTVRNADGSQFWTYSGQGPYGDGEFWSFAVDGSTAIVEVHAGVERGHGFKIEDVGHGTVDLKQRKKSGPVPEVVCGTDGKQDLACYTDVAITSIQRSVARLLFMSGRQQYLCTGWLVAGSNNSTMLTNNHCFSTQTEVRTVQASFNYQNTACGGSLGVATDFAGNQLLKTNSANRKGSKGGLDYTLLTLFGNPESAWGEITPTTRAVAPADLIYIIQHPDGGPKKIGYWEDSTPSQRCKVDTINQTYGQAAQGSQIGYACDTASGSSGSPVLSAIDGRAIGLHHYGGVGGNTCLNSATRMQSVCADAGTLLSCSTN